MKSNRNAIVAFSMILLLFGVAVWQAAKAQTDKRQVEDQEAEIASLREELRQCSGLRPAPVRHERQAPVEHIASAFRAPAPAPAKKEPDIKTKDRFITVTAKCQSAEASYEQIRMASAQLGHTPHPDITTAFSRMRIALDSARREMDDGQINEARESLDLAEASANKVLRAAGGR